MKNSTVGKLAVVAGLLGVGALGLYIKDRYFDVVETKRVEIAGLPCESGTLQTPIWIEGKTSDFNFGTTYGGGASGTGKPWRPQVHLPAGRELEVTVRVGTCRAQGGGHFSCVNPQWTATKQIVTVDTRMQAPMLTLAMTNDHACR